MRITKEEAVSMLLSMDNILIFAHENPDGDAVGSACALCHGLVSLGKKAAVWLDGIPKNDIYLTEGIMFDGSFTPEHIVTTDTADDRILGAGCGYDKNMKVELAIDHHFTNTLYAEKTYLDSESAAAGEVIYDLLLAMGVSITKMMAECMYIAISTDTGCFRYGNTKARTLRTAAALLDCGIDAGEINRIQFETKTKEFVALEKMAMNSLKTYFNGKCAVMMLTLDMFNESGTLECETQALSSLPRQIEGVYVGVTIKEKEEGFFRISVRTNAPANAAEIASHLNGGGHPMAAGCAFVGNKEDALKAVLEHSENQLRNAGLL